MLITPPEKGYDCMTAFIALSCLDHPSLLMCDDDQGFEVETVAAARALWAARYPSAVTAKTARVVITCDIACTTRIVVEAGSITLARAQIATHLHGWYVARRAGGRLVDGCQWHLGCCCVQHATRRWRDKPDPTLDPAAVLPGEPGFPGEGDAGGQLDLFAGGTA